jgi:hypothetical protein
VVLYGVCALETEPEKSPSMDFFFPGARAMVTSTELSYAEAAETSGVGTMRRMLGTLAVVEAMVVVVVVV